jgi:hypothetical protein
MTAFPSGRGFASLSIAAVLSLVFVLCASTACSSSKSKETPEQRAETGLGRYQAHIREIVKDPARADRLVDLSTQFQGVVEDAGRSLESYRANVSLLNANYDATLAEFRALFDQQDSERAGLIERAITLRTRMAAITTDAEWAELKKARVAEWHLQLAEAQS